MNDVMIRRARTENMVIGWKRATTVCQGIISEENRVYFVADCLEPDSFDLEHLKEVQISFDNGIEVSGGKSTVGQLNDVAWVRVSSSALEGVQKLPVHHTPKGQSLQDAYGSTMTKKLKSFYRSKNIPERNRCRIGYVEHRSSASVGDPVIIDGKLMALMKSVPRSYRGVWGGVSENSLAIIH